MFKLVSSVLLLALIATFVFESKADITSGCIACGYNNAPIITSTQSSSWAVQYIAVWGAPYGQDRGCYWCDTGYYNSNSGFGSCHGIPSSVTSTCNSGSICSYTNSSTWLLANPQASSQTCSTSGTKWLSFPFTSVGDLKCGCANVYVNRDGEKSDHLDFKYSLTHDEIEVLEQANAAAGRQTTSSCTQSIICDSSQRSDCPSCSTCLDTTTIPCSNIESTNQRCPGFVDSMWSNSSCPLGDGPTCSVCNYGGCTGSLSLNGACPAASPCLQCHNIKLHDGSTVCAAHLAPSAAKCFCVGFESLTSGELSCTNHRDEVAQVAQRSMSQSMAYGMCAPWGSDIVTMRCYAKVPGGANNQCQLATTDDCTNGMAVLPTACPNTYSCGGHKCGQQSSAPPPEDR